jgi:hypothetical protein
VNVHARRDAPMHSPVAHLCSSSLTFAHPRSPLLILAHLCSSSLTFAHPRSPLLILAHPCSPCLTLAHQAHLLERREVGEHQGELGADFTSFLLPSEQKSASSSPRPEHARLALEPDGPKVSSGVRKEQGSRTPIGQVHNDLTLKLLSTHFLLQLSLKTTGWSSPIPSMAARTPMAQPYV